LNAKGKKSLLIAGARDREQRCDERVMEKTGRYAQSYPQAL
jgi:hypothetical protein